HLYYIYEEEDLPLVAAVRDVDSARGQAMLREGLERGRR
ncbi:hypothetical protein KIPB_014269, partial [Kipferlia bialata]